MIDLGLNLEGDHVRQLITQELNKVVKTAADKYAPYFDVTWKIVCDDRNNTKDVIAKRKIIADIYVQVPQLSQDYVRLNAEITISTTDQVPK